MALRLPETPNQPKAQLFTLVSNITDDFLNFVSQEREDQIVINFPNLPEEIDLMRSSEWRVTSSPLLPDGFHIYDHTTPLEIPFTFKFHAFDDYSINGPETILQVAAKLQALQLPIINSKQTGGGTRDAGEVPEGGPKTEAGKEDKGENPNDQGKSGLVTGLSVDQTTYYFPPACVLNLMIGSGEPATALGICCIGYVKNVSTKLKGPWLNSGRADINRNLPSMGEFSFTFVHAPSYTNSLNFNGDNKLITAQVGAMRMKNSFYNTVNVLSEIGGGDISYKGLK